ncbi:hypothetical protein OAA38_00325 [bacterium]|jgi:hypothetical protein|nr:hypothetical protein [bacterium]
MTEKKFQFAVNLPAMNAKEIGMRIMCVDMAEVAMNVNRLVGRNDEIFYTIEEQMDGPFLTHEDLGRNP